MNIVSKLFKTANERELNKLWPAVSQINAKEPSVHKLSDKELAQKTEQFRAVIEEKYKLISGQIDELKGRILEATSADEKDKLKLSPLSERRHNAPSG